MAEQRRTVERDGLSFDVYDDGPEDGEAVVLLHGFPERSTAWREVAPLLHARGYRTLALDQRGYSPGARPRRRRDYRFEAISQDVVAVIDQLVGAPAHVVGHDWGAVVAWLVAVRRPDLVRSLTAISVPHPMAYATGGLRQLLKSWYVLAFSIPVVPELLAHREGGLFERKLAASGMTADDLARFRTEIVDAEALSGGLGYYRALFLSDPRLARRRVRVPTTFLWSDSDDFIARSSAERCGRYVDGPYDFVELAGASHWLPTQEPQACADAILARVSS
ncbi:MAG: alpha/beta fold hydrolase [Nocardioides sp.]